MKNLFAICTTFTLLILGASHAEDSIGGGVNFWTFIDDLESDVDESGLSFCASCQRHGDLLGLESVAEIFPYRLDGTAWSPQIYLLVSLNWMDRRQQDIQTNPSMRDVF